MVSNGVSAELVELIVGCMMSVGVPVLAWLDGGDGTVSAASDEALVGETMIDGEPVLARLVVNIDSDDDDDDESDEVVSDDAEGESTSPDSQLVRGEDDGGIEEVDGLDCVDDVEIDDNKEDVEDTEESTSELVSVVVRAELEDVSLASVVVNSVELIEEDVVDVHVVEGVKLVFRKAVPLFIRRGKMCCGSASLCGRAGAASACVRIGPLKDMTARAAAHVIAADLILGPVDVQGRVYACTGR